MLVVGDFLQLPLRKRCVHESNGAYRSFNGCLWEKFQLHEVVEIVWQSNDPDFTQLLNRLRERQQTIRGVFKVIALANTNVATWPVESVKVYLYNYLSGQESEACIGELDSEVAVIKAQDNNKDIERNSGSISIPDNIDLYETANLPAKLKLCVGARVILTDNISIFD